MSGRLRAPSSLAAGTVIAAALAIACTDARHEAEEYRRDLLQLAVIDTPRMRPGPIVDWDTVGGPTSLAADNPYEGNLHAIGDGQRLYRWMNCNGCHGEGGGSIGPPLWDNRWIYGGSPSRIAESIIRGRPNGMPAYGGRLSEDQVWRIVAYLQQLEPGGGLGRAGAK